MKRLLLLVALVLGVASTRAVSRAQSQEPTTPTLVPFDVMRYLDGNDLPYYWWFASHYVLQDHMFEPVTSYSLPSHLFMVSNWSAACPLTDTTTMAVISGTPTACTNQPSTPPAI